MSAGKPLTYLSLRCVLYHMEANLRFNIARCCPSIEKLEKEVPLKIEYLLHSSNVLKINNTEYQVSLICEALGEGLKSKYGFESDEVNKLVDYNWPYLKSMKPGAFDTYWSDYFDSEEEIAENAEWEALRNVMDHGSRVNVCHHIYVQCWYGDLNPRKRIERVAYNKTLTEAIKYLTDKLLGGRILHVDSFDDFR